MDLSDLYYSFHTSIPYSVMHLNNLHYIVLQSLSFYPQAVIEQNWNEANHINKR